MRLRVGDIDGFGFGLNVGQVLFDLNGNGVVAGNGDSFDNRGAGELFTDISLFRPNIQIGFPDLNPGRYLFSAVYGDYDVGRGNDAFLISLPGIQVEPVMNNGIDGLIQRIDIPFSHSGGDLSVSVNAPVEPYLAFDYFQISSGVPEPSQNIVIVTVLAIICIRMKIIWNGKI